MSLDADAQKNEIWTDVLYQNLLFNFNENSMQLCLARKVPIAKSRGELCDQTHLGDIEFYLKNPNIFKIKHHICLFSKSRTN